MTQTQQPEPWGDAAVITLARLWSYRREALLLTTVAATWILLPAIPAALATVTVGVLLSRWIIPWLHISRVRRQWATAVISAGAADPPPKRSRKAQAIRGPKVIHGRVTTVGEELVVRVGRGRGTVQSLTEHREQLAADMDGRFHHVTEVRIEPAESASRARVLIIRRDPFQDRAPIPWPDIHDQRLSMWHPIPLGVDETGDTVTVRLVERNLLIGGEPGAGKSAALSLIAATAALDPDCRLYLLDGKEVELAAWAPCAEALIGPNIEQANVLLEHLRNIMAARYQELRAAGLRKVPRSSDLPLHVLICDELALYAQDPDKTQRGLFVEQLRDLISRGRAAGIIVIAATQKPSVDVIPSMIRDLMAMRLALRCTTPQASDTILGQGHATAGADASTIPIQERGVGYLLSEGEHPTRVKAFYLDDQAITDIAGRATAGRAESELQDILTAAAEEAAAAPPTPPRQQGLTPDDLAKCLPADGDGFTRPEWTAAAGRRKWDSLARPAATLLEQGVVVQSGSGNQGDPFRYRLAVRTESPADGPIPPIPPGTSP
jgi:hypothetical protein